MKIDILQDWEKKASQVIDRQAVEKAFMDQAYGFVSNRAGVLFKDPYRLGFEIIHTNDENTNIVGAFVFRVGRGLLYAPVFFLNGDIRGYDLLYRHSVKKFVPNTPEWAEFLIASDDYSQGRSVPRSFMPVGSRSMNIDKIANPPGQFSNSQMKTASADEWDALLAEMSEPAAAGEPGSVIAPALSSQAMLEKFASLLERSPRLVELVMEVSGDPEGWDVRPEELTKQASTLGPCVAVHTDFTGEAMPAAVADHLIKYGYAVEDLGGKVADVDIVDYANDYETASVSSGSHKVLFGDGSSGTIRVFPYHRGISDASSERYDIDSPSQVFAIDDDGKIVDHNYRGGIAVILENTPQDSFEPEKIKSDDPAGGSCYYMVTENGLGFGPFRVMRVSSGSDSRRALWVTDDMHGDTGSAPGASAERLLILDPSVKESRPEEQVYSADCTFIKVQPDDEAGYGIAKSKHTLGGSATITGMVLGVGGVKTRVKKDVDGDYVVSADDVNICRGTRKEAHAQMALRLKMASSQAGEILEEVDRKGAHTVWVVPHMEKSAYMTTMEDEPNFLPPYENEYGIPEDQTQGFLIGSNTPQVQVPDRHFGDAIQHGNGTNQGSPDEFGSDVLFSESPERVAELAKRHNVPQVFEHGILKTLSATYDSSSMLERLLPKIEDGVDAVGRILFMFYRKPQDYEAMFGSDDMERLESDLTSIFKSTGLTLLDLLKRSSKYDSASGSNSLDA